ncbi:MAG: hypothetical protein U1F43_31380 [Myxococcota bacterium]
MIRWLPSPRALFNRAIDGLGVFERRYTVEFEIVCYLEMPLALIREYELAPPGTHPYALDRNTGIFYVTAMQITDGSVGVAFDEILWGIRLQPVRPKPYLVMSLVANGMMTSAPDAQRFMRDVERYRVAGDDDSGLEFGPIDNPLCFTAKSKSGRICELDLGGTPLLERSYALLPATTEVFKPAIGEGKLRRYEFIGAGLLQFLGPHDLMGRAAFSFEPHELFQLAHGNLFQDRRNRSLRPHEVWVSRPETPGVQLLTRSLDYTPSAGRP